MGLCRKVDSPGRSPRPGWNNQQHGRAQAEELHKDVLIFWAKDVESDAAELRDVARGTELAA
jgi:hypothetical protein